MKTGAAALPIRAFQWDLARQSERLDWLLAQLPRYASWGYRELYLHLEDSVEYPSLPQVARKGAYSYRDLARLVWAATRAGIGVVPIVNLLGHTQYLIQAPDLRDLNECRRPDGSPEAKGQLCPLHPRTMEVAEKLLRDMAPFCTAGKVHVGLDESYHLGRHPLSRAEIARIGVEGHFAAYVRRLHALAGGFGLRLGMWADMLALLPRTIPQLPRGLIAYDWYYYPFRRLPRIELRNFAEYDLSAALGRSGIEYWGCPMNGAFRHEPLPIFGDRLGNIASWWSRCRRTGAAGMLITSWESSRLAAEMPLLVDAAAAGLWIENEEDPRRLLNLGCRRLFGRGGPRAARALCAADEHPFSGYPRWRINARWDTVLTDEPLAGWRAERAACRQLARSPGLPPPLHASLRFRAYLAERDLFVREAARAVWTARERLDRGRVQSAVEALGSAEASAARFDRSVRAARAAARVMWLRTRDRPSTGPNERLLAEDGRRLKAWSAWLRRCIRKPALAWTASPMAGAWQLLFAVTNFAPAAQKIVAERRTAAGAWEELDGVYQIEFQAAAARPRAHRVHRLSVPVPWDGTGDPPSLRLCVRGFGQVAVAGARLTDGVRTFDARGRRRILGKPARRRGFPDFDGSRNRGLWQLRFSALPTVDRLQSRVSRIGWR